VRVVLDTNILISAVLFPGGPPELVYRLALEGRIELVTSPALLGEFGRVLTTKFGWACEPAEEAVRQIARIGQVSESSERVREIKADPADDRVLEAALAGSAEVIVSGDRHLLRLRKWRDVRIVKPTDLLSELA
jgi:putative PIN family toxin of toxin-antitoxin system